MHLDKVAISLRQLLSYKNWTVFSQQVQKDKLLVYKHVFVDKPAQTILFSEAYTRVKLRNSFTVQYLACSGEQRLGKILYFLLILMEKHAMLRRLVLVSSGESLRQHFHSTTV